MVLTKEVQPCVCLVLDLKEFRKIELLYLCCYGGAEDDAHQVFDEMQRQISGFDQFQISGFEWYIGA